MTGPAPEDLRCVIADDVRMIREQLGALMQELGFSVIHAACGSTALRAIRQSRPDIVVTDIDMPHFSGLHLLQTLRRDPDPQIASVPVIVSSGLEDPGVSRMVKQLKGSVFLKKPVSTERFVACVITLINGLDVESDSSHQSPHQVSPCYRRIASDLNHDWKRGNSSPVKTWRER